MAIRITQQYMYGNMVSGMQSSLGNYMETIEQGSSQKKVNRPSDDPAAFYRILTTRDSISETKKYMTNINEAKGWLELTDSTMSNLTTLMQSIKALMNQASTTSTASERQIMADEAWQMFGQILNLSNTEFNGNQLFAGHKYNKSAFQKGLAISVSMMDDLKPGDDGYEDSAKKKWTDALSQAQITVRGSSDKTIAVQFLEKGTLDENGFHVDNGNDTDGDGKLAFRWSADGGKTWQTDALPDGATKMIVGSGVEIDFTELLKDLSAPGEATVTANPTGPTATASGVFNSDVQVRFDDAIDLTSDNKTFNYSYSTDGGKTWVPATATTNGNGTAGSGQPLRLSIPGGYIEVDAKNAGTADTVDKGTIFDVTQPSAIDVATTAPTAPAPKVEATGNFSRDTQVRFVGTKQADGKYSGPIDLSAANTDFAYEYSTDGGKTWVTAYGTTAGATGQPLTLTIPGGSITVDATGAATANIVEEGTVTSITRKPQAEVTTPAGAAQPTVTAKGDFEQHNVQVNFVGVKQADGSYSGEIDLSAANTDFAYEYSTDGGKTWKTATATTTGNQPLELPIPGGSITVDATNANDTIEAGTGVTVKPPYKRWDIEAAEKTADGQFSTEDGTAFFLKPTGVYQGDTNNPPPQIAISSTVKGATAYKNLDVTAEGVFGANVLVRFEGAKQADGTFSGEIDLAGNGEFAYSYSTDNGATWVTASAQATGNQPLRLPVPGGFIDVDAVAASDSIEAGTQVLIHPQRADLGYEVLKNTYIDVNRVGTEIFGGYYENKPMLSEETNLFNIMGDFIAALEFNNQEGCQEAYAKLSSCLEYVTTQSAYTGALENRVSLAYDVNSSTLLSQEEVLSGTEDIDLTELLTKMTQQQMAYQTVLKSSSMIMNLGLMNYL